MKSYMYVRDTKVEANTETVVRHLVVQKDDSDGVDYKVIAVALTGSVAVEIATALNQ